MKLLPSARPQVGNEQGFILILTLIILVLLTLFGVWAMQTSDMETRVAANNQRLDQAVYFAEGSNYVESALLGDGKRPEYKLKNLNPNRVLIPAANDFDSVKNENRPKGYTLENYKKAFSEDKLATDDHYDNEEAYLQAKSELWPRDNLLAYSVNNPNRKDPSLDYQYLATFINVGSSPLEGRGGMAGFSAESNAGFTSYWFRVQGRQAATSQSMNQNVTINAVLESGGHKTGPNALQ